MTPRPGRREEGHASGVPDLAVERDVLRSGARWVAGVDEVGRGAVAGPVAVGAVVLPNADSSLLTRLSGVRDSKQLDPESRCLLCDDILAVASGVSVASVGPAAVDALGIVNALRLAVCRAIQALPVRPDVVLVDGLPVRGLPHRQRAIVRGDESVLSIACASVVAKAYRDAMMIALSLGLPEYGFDEHKGYLTPEHQGALAAAGATWLHRLTWRPFAGLTACPIADPEPTEMTFGGRSKWLAAGMRVECDRVVSFRTGGP